MSVVFNGGIINILYSISTVIYMLPFNAKENIIYTVWCENE